MGGLRRPDEETGGRRFRRGRETRAERAWVDMLCAGLLTPHALRSLLCAGLLTPHRAGETRAERLFGVLSELLHQYSAFQNDFQEWDMCPMAGVKMIREVELW